MRVIAGSAGGRRLQVPRRGVRPTMDRVKAAIFSSLAERVPGARVLDLFAGAGGLGIEALSRGAASVFFVESDREAAAAIRKNLTLAELDAAVFGRDVWAYLRNAHGAFDIIFADPPYERMAGGASFTQRLLQHETLPRIVAPGGVFVLEKRPGEFLPSHPAWTLERSRRYGATEVLFLNRAA